MSATDPVTPSPGNPVFRPDDVPHLVATVHNAAVARLDHGRAVLRSHVATGRSILGKIDDIGFA